MKQATLALGLTVGLWAAGPGAAYFVAIPEQYPREIARLTKEYHQLKLGQIAILIDDYSNGESTLLIGRSAGAGPKVGMVARGLAWGDIPFIAVCPASRPVPLKLEGIGRCQLLGAAALLVEAVAGECDDKDKHVVAKPDVYLLAHGINDGWLDEVRLVAVTVDDEGRRHLRVVLRTLAKRDETRLVPAPMPESEAIPAAVVSFPGPDEVSDDNPASRATTALAWEKEFYRFALDLRITMG